jgi:hypothetical protein
MRGLKRSYLVVGILSFKLERNWELSWGSSATLEFSAMEAGMTRQNVETILAGLPPSLADLGRDIASQFDREFANGAVTTLRFPVQASLLTREAFDHFRNTEWLLTAGPDNYFGPNYQLAVLRRKVALSPKPEFCFHSTEATNHSDILAEGLFPGNRVGRSPRRRDFGDSEHYIFASLTLDEATRWVERLGNRGDFCIYQLRVRGFDLIPDPCAVMIDGRAEGYILTTDHVPATLIVDVIHLEWSTRITKEPVPFGPEPI